MRKQERRQESKEKGITLVALVITILFSYDEKIKCSNSKGFTYLENEFVKNTTSFFLFYNNS